MTTKYTDPETSQSSAVNDALSRVATLIAVAQGLASTGRSIDLTGLDVAAGVMCAGVLDLPPNEGAALRPALTDLEAKLSLLAKSLMGRPA